MDTPLDTAIKATERQLALMKQKNPEAVFKCPECGRYFSQLGNYRDLGMCGSCFEKVKTKEMDAHVQHLLGGTIVDIKVEKADPISFCRELVTVITQISVKTKDGQIVKLNKEKEVHYLL